MSVAGFRIMRDNKQRDRGPRAHADLYLERDKALATSALVLELTAACNAKCPGCFPQYLDLPKGFADANFVRETISAYAAKGGEVLVFTARGEPLLDKRIPKFVKFAKDCGIAYVEFTSNGQLLTETMALELIESGLDAMRFSMTGATQEVYARWQGYKSPFRLEETEMNILRLANLRAVMGSVTPKMYLRYIYDGSSDDQDAMAYFRKWINQVDEIQFTARLPVIKGRNAIEVKEGAEISDIPKLFSSGVGNVPCGAIGGFAVTSDGMVTVCSSGMGEQQLSVGNLRESPFSEVADAYLKGVAELKETHAKGIVEELPDPCQSCFAIIDGGNNCQDFDILLMMTVAYTIESAKHLASGKGKGIVIIGANTFAKMCLLHAGFRDLVVKIVDPTYSPAPNPFEPDGDFKGIPVERSTLRETFAENIIILADEALREATIGAATHDVLEFWTLLSEVNDRTFRLPDLRGVYTAPGNVWHYQTQVNVCFWALRQYLRSARGPIAVSTSDYYAADRLLQASDIAQRVAAPVSIFEKRGDIKKPHCRGDVAPLNELHNLTASGTILVWNQVEYDAALRYIESFGERASFEIVNYELIRRRTRLWLSHQAAKDVGIA